MPLRATSIMPLERYYADDDADRGDEQDGAHGCGFGADGGVEEIDCVVGDADEKT